MKFNYKYGIFLLPFLLCCNAERGNVVCLEAYLLIWSFPDENSLDFSKHFFVHKLMTELNGLPTVSVN